MLKAIEFLTPTGNTDYIASQFPNDTLLFIDGIKMQSCREICFFTVVIEGVVKEKQKTFGEICSHITL